MKPSAEWMMQRITGLISFFAAIIIASIIYYSCVVNQSDIYFAIKHCIKMPFISSLIIILVSSMLYNGAIGIKVAMEDYINNVIIRNVVTKILFGTIYWLILTFSMSIITMHVILNLNN